MADKSVEVLDDILPRDLNDLCDAAESAITEGGGLVHVHRAISTLDEADNVLVQQTLFVLVGYLADAGFPAYQLLKGVLRKDTVHAGQTKRDTGDHVGVSVALGGGLEHRDRLDRSGLEAGRGRDRGHRRPRGWWRTYPSGEVARRHRCCAVKFRVGLGFRSDGGDHPLHLIRTEPQTGCQNDMTVAEGGRVATEGGNAITNIGLDGPVACII